MSDEHTINRTTVGVMHEVAKGRIAAHAKHGDESIEAVHGHDLARWLPILLEEVGEVGEALTYDKSTGPAERWANLRAELIDVTTVATAWIAALDAVEDGAPFHANDWVRAAPGTAEWSRTNGEPRRVFEVTQMHGAWYVRLVLEEGPAADTISAWLNGANFALSKL